MRRNQKKKKEKITKENKQTNSEIECTQVRGGFLGLGAGEYVQKPHKKNWGAKIEPAGCRQKLYFSGLWDNHFFFVLFWFSGGKYMFVYIRLFSFYFFLFCFILVESKIFNLFLKIFSLVVAFFWCWLFFFFLFPPSLFELHIHFSILTPSVQELVKDQKRKSKKKHHRNQTNKIRGMKAGANAPVPRTFFLVYSYCCFCCFCCFGVRHLHVARKYTSLFVSNLL